MTRPSFAPALRHQIAIAAAFIAMAMVVALLSPGKAMAGVSGQIGAAWGPPTELEGEQLIFPTESGFDPSDGSVYISATSEDESETVIRKFTSTGELKGTLRLPTRAYQGIAVDPTHHRFYLLAVARPEEHLEATKVLAFSTIPVNGELVPADPGELTLPTGTETLLEPREIVVDPSTGDLVILANEEHGVEPEPITEVTTLQRIDVDPLTGAMSVGARFVQEVPIEVGRVLVRAVAIDKAGVTYLFGAGESHGERGERLLLAETLPPDFTAASALTPLPGFQDAVNEGNGSIRIGLILVAGTGALVNRGPQIAVSTSPTGEDTLYWKVNPGGFENYLVESWSVDGEARSTVFGGGTEEEECALLSPLFSLGAEENGDLAVFDSGELANLGEPLQVFPVVYHFGPGGSGCPAPTPAFKLESEGQAVATVESGSVVTANTSETQLNGAPALEGATWKVKGPEEFTEPITGPTPAFAHRFKKPGNYSVYMAIQAKATSPDGFSVGEVFSAQPQHLEVTAAPVPTVTGVTPDEGSMAGGTEVTISGTNLGGTTEVKFGGEAVACTEVVATCRVEGNTELKATVPALAAGTVDVRAVTASGESPIDAPADQFTVVKPAQPEFTLTVSRSGSGAGTVTSAPAGINCGTACEAKFVEQTSVTLTASAAAGSSFAGWGGACSGTSPTCVVPMDSAKTVTGTFDAEQQQGNTQTPPSETHNAPPSETHSAPPIETKPSPKPTQKELIAKKRKAALKKCQKLKGKAKSMCVKKANQIGKPKKKSGKARG